MTLKEFKNLKIGTRIKINDKWIGNKRTKRFGNVLLFPRNTDCIIRIKIDNRKIPQDFHYTYIDIINLETHGPGSFVDKVMSGSDIGGV